METIIKLKATIEESEGVQRTYEAQREVNLERGINTQFEILFDQLMDMIFNNEYIRTC